MPERKYANIASPSPKFNPISNREFRSIEIIANDFKISRLNVIPTDSANKFEINIEQHFPQNFGRDYSRPNRRFGLQNSIRLDRRRIRSKKY